MIEDKDKLDKVIEEAKSLLTLFESLKEKTEINFNCSFLKHLDRISIAKFIVPYLDLKDIICFRSTCKDMNMAVLSLAGLVSYSKIIEFKYKKASQPKMELKNFNDINDSEDVKLQLETLTNTRDFLKSKLFESERIIKVYRNDIEYLKSEAKQHEEITARLNETLQQTREEQEEAKKTNVIIKQKLYEMNKKLEENAVQNNRTIEDLKKEVDTLKLEKAKLAQAVVQFKKSTDELKKKNMSKAEALKSIRNFFLTSTLMKLKNYPEFNDNSNSQCRNTNTNQQK